MNVTLDIWQERLERHFHALSERRAETGTQLFALEHGISDSDIAEISTKLREYLRQGYRLTPHWLLWTIYAAERGYIYDGDEYWQSFVEATPGWDNNNRHLISEWYSRFQKTYNGVKPSGLWAEHFSIIAWPITHAILPRYLQRQFARTLYDLRFQLARLQSIDPTAIGHLIATNVHSSSKRLDQFFQQKELVGRIVLALLHQQNIVDGHEHILPATLERIITDLEKIRNAHGWIKETQHVVSNRLKVLGHGTGPHPRHLETETLKPPEKVPDIRPNLNLHYRGHGDWDLLIDIPSFKCISSLNPEIHQFLKKTRCLLNGSSGIKPAGWLLSGRRQAILKEWPDPQQPLINFEERNNAIEHFLDSDCRMSNGPIWLFRVGRDGYAREITGHVVRPGYNYIIISEKPIDNLLEGMARCKITCSMVSAISVSVPQVIPDSYIHWLKERKLVLACTVRVWPAGFAGRNWDGEGQSEWLTTEHPCFGIVPDHTVESYLVSLTGLDSIIVKAGEPGVPTFIQLPELPPGRHRLTIRANYFSLDVNKPSVHEGFLELRVREPEPWVPGTASHSGLIISSNPYDAALDAFWENEYKLFIYGPKGRRVIPHIVLQNAKEEELFNRQICPHLELPVIPDVWNRRFSEFLKREKCEWRYLEASYGLLMIDGGELGRYILRFEHEVRPVRWGLQHDSNTVSIRLVDETDQEGITPQCWFYNMERPLDLQLLKPETALKGLRVDAPGGLFIAKIGAYSDALIVSTGLTGEGLYGLGAHPNHGHISSDPKAFVDLLRLLRDWLKTRVAGYLANERRCQVTNAIMHGIVGIIAGWDWANLESMLIRESDLNIVLDSLESRVRHNSGFSNVIRRDASGLDGNWGALVSWYAELANRYQVCSDTELCRFAIDFASRPQSIPTLYSEALPDKILRAMTLPALMRGARLAVLCRLCAKEGAEILLPEDGT